MSFSQNSNPVKYYIDSPVDFIIIVVVMKSVLICVQKLLRHCWMDRFKIKFITGVLG